MNAFSRAIVAAMVAGLTPAWAVALDSAPQLNLEVAKRMADACEAMSAREGWRMTIAIMDGGANPVALTRMDGAFIGSIDIALGKARTSARFPFPTRMVANLGYGEDAKGGPCPVLPRSMASLPSLAACRSWRAERISAQSASRAEQPTRMSNAPRRRSMRWRTI